MLVAQFDDFPVGFMGYGVNSDNTSVYIEPMMVDYMFQCKGIGKKMMDLFCQRIKSENIYKAITIGNRTDNIPAGKTYEKAGFRLIRQEGLSSFRRKEL